MEEKQKKPIFKKWWFWVIVIIVIGAIAAANGGGNKPTAVDNVQKQDDSGPKVVDTTNTEKNDSPKEFKIGDVVKMGDHKLTVLEVKKSNGNDFDKPKNGHEYVIVTVKIENDGKEKISYNPFDFKMSNSQGQITDIAFSIIDQDTHLNSGDLAAGGDVSGTLVFEQPKDDPKLQLQYKPSFWSDDTILVNLQ